MTLRTRLSPPVKIAALVSLTFAALSFVLVGFNTRFVSNRLADSAYKTNARAVALLERNLRHTIDDAFSSAELLLDIPNAADRIQKSPLLLSIMAIDWKREDFAYSARIDNFDRAAITKTIETLHDDIANGGSGQEQAYATQLGEETPVLVFVRPVSGRSILTVLNAKELLDQLKDTANSLTFVVDRFGTILLHPEQDRAIHRESALENAVLKRLFLSAADREGYQFNEGFGFFSRIPFAGITVVSQIPVASVLEPIGTLRFTLLLVALLTICGAFAAFYAIAKVAWKEKEEGKDAQSELKLAS